MCTKSHPLYYDCSNHVVTNRTRARRLIGCTCIIIAKISNEAKLFLTVCLPSSQYLLLGGKRLHVAVEEFPS